MDGSIRSEINRSILPELPGGVGWTRTIVNGLNLYVLAKSGLQNNRLDRGTLWAGPEVGGFIEPFNWWKISVKYEYEVFLNGLKSKTDIWKLEQRFGSSRTWDFRIEYHQMNDKQLGLNFGLYI
jgi:hypothetical protein